MEIMNFVELFICTLESQINTEYEWIDVTWWIKWTTENIVDKLAIQVNVYWENTAIAEILLSKKNLYYPPWCLENEICKFPEICLGQKCPINLN